MAAHSLRERRRAMARRRGQIAGPWVSGLNAPSSRISLTARTTCPSCSDVIACTHHRPSTRPSQNTTYRYSLARIRRSTQHATSSMYSRRSQPPAHSAADRRCTQRTAEVQRRQLRHPSETRCQRRCPSCFDPIACTYRRPSARLCKPYRPLQPRAQPSQPTARSIICALPAFATTRSQRSAAAENARSVLSRFSEVSCVILPRLRASDAPA